MAASAASSSTASCAAGGKGRVSACTLPQPHCSTCAALWRAPGPLRRPPAAAALRHRPSWRQAATPAPVCERRGGDQPNAVYIYSETEEQDSCASAQPALACALHPAPRRPAAAAAGVCRPPVTAPCPRCPAARGRPRPAKAGARRECGGPAAGSLRVRRAQREGPAPLPKARSAPAPPSTRSPARLAGAGHGRAQHMVQRRPRGWHQGRALSAHGGGAGCVRHHLKLGRQVCQPAAALAQQPAAKGRGPQLRVQRQQLQGGQAERC